MLRRLADLLAIRPGEDRLAGLVLGIMLLNSMGSALGSAGVETLFFTRFGVQFLPYMYMVLGLVTMGASLAITAVLGRASRERVYLMLPLLLAGLLLAGRLLLLLESRGIYPILWLGKEVINTLSGLLVWGVAGIVFDTRQARRLFPLFGAGRILGSVLGGFLTGWLVTFLGTENLILVWLGTLLLAFLLGHALLNARARRAPRQRGHRSQPSGFVAEVQQGYAHIRGSALMRWISIASLLFSVLYFSIALPFSRAATQQFPGEAELAGFLGMFQGLSTAAAFLASLFLANRLFARFGIMSMILVFTLIYVIGFGSMILAPVFAVITVFRFIQMLWLSGIADSAYQAMFNVVPSGKRDQVRAFMSGVPDQAGTFIAGLILLIGEQTFTPAQLSAVGLFAALACSYVIWQARRAYHSALVEALRLGRPSIFFSEEEPFGGFRRDSAAVSALIEGTHSDDLVIRRVSSEILGQVSIPEAGQALLQALHDSDPVVRIHSLRALVQGGMAAGADEFEQLLNDPEPEVRLEAIHCIRQLAWPLPQAIPALEPLLGDPVPRVSIQAAAALLQMTSHAQALHILSELLTSEDEETRLAALAAIPEGFDLVAQQLTDKSAPVRHAAVAALLRLDGRRALPLVIPMLADPKIQVGVAAEIAGAGPIACGPLLEVLSDPSLEQGVLLTLARLPLPDPAPVESFARSAVARALHYHDLGSCVASRTERASLLLDLLREKAQYHGLGALRAIGLLSDRASMSLALEGLAGYDPSMRSDVLELLESLGEKRRPLVRPLLALWEQDSSHSEPPLALQEGLSRMFSDSDPWLRACAGFFALEQPACAVILQELIRSEPDPFVRSLLVQPDGDSPMDTLPTLSLMERILFFRRVPLFERLSTTELKNVAAISDEVLFADGEQLAAQNEIGETMYLIVSGEILVSASLPDGGRKEIAHRQAGDCVGEMSLISQEPRMASLVAMGDVRALSIDQRNFQGLLRERPEVSLGVMQVLCSRIRELAR